MSKEKLLNLIEFEKDFAKRCDKVQPHIVLGTEKGIIPIFIDADRFVIRKILDAALKTNFEFIVVVFEGKAKTVKKEEELKKYEYGSILNDPKAKDCIIIWGIEKETNYRVYIVFERKGNDLIEIAKMENEEFDKVRGFLSFMG